MRPGVTSRTRKKQVCPCLNLCTAPTCSCVFVRVVLSKKNQKKPELLTFNSLKLVSLCIPHAAARDPA